jgi:hypothetical protein
LPEKSKIYAGKDKSFEQFQESSKSTTLPQKDPQIQTPSKANRPNQLGKQPLHNQKETEKIANHPNPEKPNIQHKKHKAKKYKGKFQRKKSNRKNRKSNKNDVEEVRQSQSRDGQADSQRFQKVRRAQYLLNEK